MQSDRATCEKKNRGHEAGWLGLNELMEEGKELGDTVLPSPLPGRKLTHVK